MITFFSIFFGTFILEDLALATSIALMSAHKLSFLDAFLSCFLGISIGDLGLYGLGYIFAKYGTSYHFPFLERQRSKLEDFRHSKLLHYSIVISRLIPGTRLPTYLSAGFFRYPFWRFLLLTFGSVFTWVVIALLGGNSLQYFFKEHWIPTLILFLPALHVFKILLSQMMDPWQRKAFKFSWKKYLYFEFWPAWFFYLPIVPIYLFLALKHRSFLMPFYANPNLKHGGLIGESKWEFIKHLNKKEACTLNSVKLPQEMTLLEVQICLQENDLTFPFILKPDVGQRGFAVRIIRTPEDLANYLNLSSFDRIAQRLSLLPHEAGVFYLRKPSESIGQILSITDKKFPTVIGDGKTSLGDLILRDSRARMIAPVYFERLADKLDQVLTAGNVQVLAECGNHCQGAIFLNGKDLMSPALTKEIDRISKQIPDFYFGRFDIRYESKELLKQGKSFEIVEINGAGSEATHIWDAKTTLREAYRSLFVQWSSLFAIGDEAHRMPNRKYQLQTFEFLKECARVYFRKDRLSVSS